MVQSVELLLDHDADDAVRRQWQTLTDAGVPSLRSHTAPSNRPHITVAVAREMWPRIDRRLERDVDFTPFAVRLGGVLVFGGKRPVLARLVVPTEALLSLHRVVYDIVASCPGIPAHTCPGEWTPHVTLARRLTTHTLGTAVGAVVDVPDTEARVVGIRRWDGEVRREWRIC